MALPNLPIGRVTLHPPGLRTRRANQPVSVPHVLDLQECVPVLVMADSLARIEAEALDRRGVFDPTGPPLGVRHAGAEQLRITRDRATGILSCDVNARILGKQRSPPDGTSPLTERGNRSRRGDLSRASKKKNKDRTPRPCAALRPIIVGVLLRNLLPTPPVPCLGNVATVRLARTHVDTAHLAHVRYDRTCWLAAFQSYQYPHHEFLSQLSFFQTCASAPYSPKVPP